MKKELGQFFTTNYEQILDGMSIPKNAEHIIEPFVGAGDLLPFIGPKTIVAYDIDPKIDEATKRDTLKNPPDYKDKYVCTNPPYLARNKSGSANKTIFDMYGENDLYKCFIASLIADPPDGGIIIIPLNFWSSIRKSDVDLRRRFLEKFSVDRVNVFEDQVFDDTTYSVCAVQFTQGEDTCIISFHIYSDADPPVALDIQLINYTIGGEIYNLPQSDSVKVSRLTKYNINADGITDIKLKCIDDGALIGMMIDSDRYVDETDKSSARSYATLIITIDGDPINNDRQTQLTTEFNEYLNEKRQQYNSLFLTNYREGSRKRISFGLVFEITNYLLSR